MLVRDRRRKWVRWGAVGASVFCIGLICSGIRDDYKKPFAQTTRVGVFRCGAALELKPWSAVYEHDEKPAVTLSVTTYSWPERLYYGRPGQLFGLYWPWPIDRMSVAIVRPEGIDNVLKSDNEAWAEVREMKLQAGTGFHELEPRRAQMLMDGEPWRARELVWLEAARQVAIVVCGAIAWLWWVRWAAMNRAVTRITKGQCAYCGYCRRGMALAARCPECGRPGQKATA